MRLRGLVLAAALVVVALVGAIVAVPRLVENAAKGADKIAQRTETTYRAKAAAQSGDGDSTTTSTAESSSTVPPSTSTTTDVSTTTAKAVTTTTTGSGTALSTTTTTLSVAAVPNVTGDSVSAAEGALEAVGLTSFDVAVSCSAKGATVTSQSPAAGALARLYVGVTVELGC